MWRRLCKLNGQDLFSQILTDIAKYYEPDHWKSFGVEADMIIATTEKKQRKCLRTGIDMVCDSYIHENV